MHCHLIGQLSVGVDMSEIENVFLKPVADYLVLKIILIGFGFHQNQFLKSTELVVSCDSHSTK